MNPIQKLPPFKRIPVTIGALPSSYVDSLSYYETLVWLINYLQKTVIPALNTNAQAIEELQTLFTQLKDYVDNYFENLDVQEEINNKLDDMAESGTLQDIIVAYLQVSGVLAYDTVADMVAATNLIDGSTAKTLGKLSYLDGEGAFYKIRTITNEDVIDGINIIAITSSDTLIAEYIPYTNLKDTIDDINQNIDDIEEEISDGQIVFLGDSYGLGSENNNKGWIDYLAQYMGLESTDYYKFAYGGSGFIGQSESLPILTVLQNNISSITDTTKVKKIIIGLGANDINETTSDIETAIDTFMAYVNTNFENAKVFLFVIGYSVFNTGANTSYVINMQKVFNAYKHIEEYNVPINANSCDILRIDGYMNTSNNHPTDAGYKQIAKAMLNILNSGNDHNANNVQDTYESTSYNPITMYSGQSISNISNGNISITYVNGSGVINIINTNDYQNWIEMQFNNMVMSTNDIPIGTIPMKNFHPAYLRINIPVMCVLGFANYTQDGMVGRLEITADGNVHLFIPKLFGAATAEVTNINIYQICPVTLPIGLL